MKKTFLMLFLGISTTLSAQLQNNDVHKLGNHMNESDIRNEIRLPMVDGFLPLKCDFHMHTVFSDGHVMPRIRVQEAWQQGLDAIAITDHIEYRPLKNILKGDLNESNKLAKKAAQGMGLVVINGTEITKSKPFGHMNALFVTDVNPMDVKDPLVAIDTAINQGAFILWNHPGWPDDKSTLYPIHEQLIKENKIHAVEVFNMYEYYPVSFDWCNDYNLAYVANSDVHGLISVDYGMKMKQRPLTIVFAKEKSEEAIREALFAKRTVAFFDGQLAGPEDILRKMVLASLVVTPVSENRIEVYNNSDVSYRITNGENSYQLPAGKTVSCPKLKTGRYTVENCHVGANEKLVFVVDAEACEL